MMGRTTEIHIGLLSLFVLCLRLMGSLAHRTSCDAGYQLQDDGTCADINECVSDSTNDCKQVCVNSEGSYTCDCNEGYELAGDGTTCTDIDYCESAPCINGGTCRDHLLSYTCACPYGYEGAQCEDDLCKNQGNNFVASNDGNCRTYIQCNQSGPAMPMCCRGGRKFDAAKGECVQAYLTACIQELCPEDHGEECRLAESVWGKAFFVDLDDHNKRVHKCPGGTEFSLETCGCDNSNSGGCPVVNCQDGLELHPQLCVCVWHWMMPRL